MTWEKNLDEGVCECGEKPCDFVEIKDKIKALYLRTRNAERP